jgi:SAM-dependent methyltransferase
VRRDLHEQNRKSWNHATVAHNSHKGDQAAFLRDGGSTLFPEELELLGDLRDKRLVHLQCNAGQDTLSLAARGALVTGVDISDEAIGFATQLSADAGIPARFERADVYDWIAAAPRGAYDLVFASYGALCWLSDLRTWARGIASLLAPGGRLVVMEFHPALYLFEERDGAVALATSPPDRHWTWPAGIDDYVARSGPGLLHGATYETGVVDFANPEACHEFEHSLADVVDAVARSGLVLEQVREWPYSNGCKFFTSMRDLGARRWAMPADAPQIPLMYGLTAQQPRRGT